MIFSIPRHPEHFFLESKQGYIEVHTLVQLTLRLTWSKRQIGILLSRFSTPMMSLPCYNQFFHLGFKDDSKFLQMPHGFAFSSTTDMFIELFYDNPSVSCRRASNHRYVCEPTLQKFCFQIHVS